MRYFVPVLLTLFVLAALLRVDFYFTIVYLLLALFLLSRLWTQRTVNALHVRRRYSERAFLGDRVEVEVILQNRSGLPMPWVELNEQLPVELRIPPFYRRVLSLGRQEQCDLQYTLVCRRRGYYPIGPLQIRTGDLFGFHRNQSLTLPPDHLIVYPKVVPLQQLGLPTRSPLVSLPAHSPLFEDPSRVMGVRAYQRGDSPRRIHWTATAGAGQLLVKQYQPAIARETLICLDLNEEDFERGVRFTATELAVVVAASLATHIIVREGLPAGLAVAAWDPLQEKQTSSTLLPRSERAHLMYLLELLARVQVTEGMPFAEMIRQESARLPWGATIVVIAGAEGESLLDTLLYLQRAGFAVALVLVQSNAPSTALKERAALLRIPIHRVWNERDIEAWTTI
ncbi:MAG: DUF58 domain-containing protein [Chloroflexota bacterium]|nr:DUF58 domain-containing protein [Chloroflexota bacterium]